MDYYFPLNKIVATLELFALFILRTRTLINFLCKMYILIVGINLRFLVRS